MQPVKGNGGVDPDVHPRAVSVVCILEPDDLPAIALPRVALARLEDIPVVVGGLARVLGYEDVARLGGCVVDDDAAGHLETYSELLTGQWPKERGGGDIRLVVMGFEKKGRCGAGSRSDAARGIVRLVKDRLSRRCRARTECAEMDAWRSLVAFKPFYTALGARSCTLA